MEKDSRQLNRTIALLAESSQELSVFKEILLKRTFKIYGSDS